VLDELELCLQQALSRSDHDQTKSVAHLLGRNDRDEIDRSGDLNPIGLDNDVTDLERRGCRNIFPGRYHSGAEVGTYGKPARRHEVGPCGGDRIGDVWDRCAPPAAAGCGNDR
jgi:hypothetical protein